MVDMESVDTTKPKIRTISITTPMIEIFSYIRLVASIVSIDFSTNALGLFTPETICHCLLSLK